jgi:hypothetical protein
MDGRTNETRDVVKKSVRQVCALHVGGHLYTLTSPEADCRVFCVFRFTQQFYPKTECNRSLFVVSETKVWTRQRVRRLYDLAIMRSVYAFVPK